MPNNKRPEVWAGVECTVNRVGDTYRDQLILTGHHDRQEDLDHIAALGVRTLRYPVVWERVAPDLPDEHDWRWSDARLSRLRELGIRPIAGLLHHGSGPRYTDLLDPRFPELFAAYARHVAERYPWLELYTPINEPLTTARFVGLYGHWYPHGRSDASFVRALLNQCRGIVAAMAEIRAVNPAAQLVQTEDLAKTHATPALAYQARFENHRRWLSFDLLSGHVVPGHPLWSYLISAGASEGELHWFAEHACPPDILGANYYVLSERFLDEDVTGHPPEAIGGNGRVAYADIGAVHSARGIDGARVVLAELWRRYRRPIAITEVHQNCATDDQLRWFCEVWDAACAVKRDGADIVAVTMWSLFGASDWNSLVTQLNGFYEPGAWDVRTGQPEPTPLADLLRQFAHGRPVQDPKLARPGWWWRDRDVPQRRSADARV